MAKSKENDIEKLYRQAKYIVTELFYEKDLSESQNNLINTFVSDYFALLNNHLNGIELENDLEKLQLYEMVLNEVYSKQNELNIDEYPALKIIVGKMNEYNKTIENKFAKVRKIEPKQNGYAKIAFLIFTTILAGIGIGALLWVIK